LIKLRGLLVLLLPLVGTLHGCAEADRENTITVFAAASLSEPLSELTEQFTRDTGTRVRLNLASSSTLARQITQGAEADVFVSAHTDWMQYVIEHGSISENNRHTLMGNRLVLVASRGHNIPVQWSKDFDFSQALQGKLSLGDPDHVPAGIYAKQALQSLDWWAPLQDHLLPAADARQALRYVELGEANAGLVYRSDATGNSRVVLVSEVPESLHTPIRYQIAPLESAKPAAEALLLFLRSANARAVFEAAGFDVH